MFRAENIHRWVGNIDILKWVDIEVVAGQAVWLVWPNGCWKTSFLNTINGFNTITSWDIYLDQVNITSLSVEQRALAGIWRVFQSFGIFKGLSLYENLALAYVKQLWWKHKLLPVSYLPQPIKSEIEHILHEVDLREKKDELAWNLSWWQMRLLEIARLYLQKTRLFLLDEPTAGVSPKLKEKVIELIKKIIALEKMVIIVEHDFAFLGQFVDSLYVMESWNNFAKGTYEQIKNNKAVKEIYFW